MGLLRQTDPRNHVCLTDVIRRSLLELANFSLNSSNNVFLDSIAPSLVIYTEGLDTPCAILKALRKRVAPTDRARQVELSIEYQAHKNVFKSQSIVKYLQQWETTCSECEKLKLPDTQDHRAVCDFIQAVKTINSAYRCSYQVYLNRQLNKGLDIPTLYNAGSNSATVFL